MGNQPGFPTAQPGAHRRLAKTARSTETGFRGTAAATPGIPPVQGPGHDPMTATPAVDRADRIIQRFIIINDPRDAEVVVSEALRSDLNGVGTPEVRMVDLGFRHRINI